MSISTRSRTRSSHADDAGPDPEPEAPRAALGLARGALVGGQRRASADVARRRFAASWARRSAVELLGRAVAGVGRGPRRAALGRRARSRAGAPSGGTARTGRVSPPPADRRALVPVDAQPVEPVEDVLLERGGAAGDVGVLEAEHERAAGVAREQEVEQRGARGPDVQGAGRAGRDPDADVGGHAIEVGAPSGHGTCGTAPGRASPGSTRISAAGRRPSVARPRGPSSVSESSDLGAGQDRDRARPGVSARASR